MPIKFERTPSGVWSPQRRAHVANNLFTAFQQASPEERALGNKFYPDWNEDSQYLADQAGVSPAHGAAMLARLSPQTEAEMNRMMGYQLLSVGSKASEHMHASAEFARQAMSTPKGPEREALVEASRAARMKAGLQGTPLNLQSSLNVSAALRHRNGESIDPLNDLGDVKINDFGHAIFDPWAKRQVIDTHYHDAALGRTDIPYDADRGLGTKSRYEDFQHSADVAYQKAVGLGVVDPAKTPPNGFMGGIWYHQQQVKVNTNPKARKARLASESRIANFLGSSGSAAWDPAAHGMRPSVSHTNTGQRKASTSEEPTGTARVKAEASAAAIHQAVRRKRGIPTYQDLGNEPYEGWA